MIDVNLSANEKRKRLRLRKKENFDAYSWLSLLGMASTASPVVVVEGAPGRAWAARRRICVASGLVALVGLVGVIAMRGGAGSEAVAGSLAPTLGSSGFKVIAGWKSHHHAYARYVKEIFVDAGAPRALIRRNHYSIQFVPLPMAFNDQSLRVALWDHAETPTMLFTGSPGLGAMGRRDIVAWVSSGRNLVFTGGYRQLAAMNELFGFALEEVPYTPGPFWRNPRNTPGTPFAYGPDRLEEYTGSAIYGVKIDSIPLAGYSMYDTFRVSSVFYIKYNLGTVCYVGASFQGMAPSNPWGKALRDAIRM